MTSFHVQMRRARTSRVEGKSYQGIETSVKYRRDMNVWQSVLTLGRSRVVYVLSEQYNEIAVTTSAYRRVTAILRSELLILVETPQPPIITDDGKQDKPPESSSDQFLVSSIFYPEFSATIITV